MVIPVWNLSPEAEQNGDNGRNIATSFAVTEARKTATALQKDFDRTEYSFFFFAFQIIEFLFSSAKEC